METLFDTSFSCNTSTSSIFQVENSKTPSFHHSQTSTKSQQKERKMKRDEVKKKKKEKVWLKI
jgi:hypothetical protein